MKTCETTPEAILGAVAAIGVILTAPDPETLRVRPAGLLTQELRELIQAHKPALLAYLTTLEKTVHGLADYYQVSDAERMEMLEAGRRDPANALRSHTETERLIRRMAERDHHE